LPKYSNQNYIKRIIDANLNRTKEGLRVCEEITRFALNNRALSLEFKRVRHKIDGLFVSLHLKLNLLKERNSIKDVGKTISLYELKRKNCQDIFFANIQRVKESIRVLEEFSKLINRNIAIEFKKIRYRIYEIEKRAAQRISASCHYR